MKRKKAGRPKGKADRHAARMKRLEKAIWAARKQLETGRVIVIDPSCASTRTGEDGARSGSLPGWCLYENGQYVESGVISVGEWEKADAPFRMYEIGRVIREELIPQKGPFSVGVIEDIPFGRFRGSNMSSAGLISLYNAVGAFFSNILPEKWIKVRPNLWHAWAPAGYVKSDEGDAVAIAVAVFGILHKMKAERAAPKLPGATRRVRVKTK